MMLVSSSGWAHSPITLILIGLSIEFAVGGAALPGIAAVIAIAAAVSTAPVSRTRKRFIDCTSVLLRRTTEHGDLQARSLGRPLFGRTHSRDIEHRSPADPMTARLLCQAGSG